MATYQLLFVALCILLLVLTTTHVSAMPECRKDNGGGSADAVDCRRTDVVAWTFSGPLFDKNHDHDTGMKNFAHIMSIALNVVDFPTMCPNTQWRVQDWRPEVNQIQSIMWYDDADGNDIYTNCSKKFIGEEGTIRAAVNKDKRVNDMGVSLTVIYPLSVPKPLTCFNGKKDLGEVDVDCGADACEMACASGSRCVYDTDCIENCFASKCMIINAAYHGMSLLSPLLLAIAALAVLFVAVW